MTDDLVKVWAPGETGWAAVIERCGDDTMIAEMRNNFVCHPYRVGQRVVVMPDDKTPGSKLWLITGPAPEPITP